MKTATDPPPVPAFPTTPLTPAPEPVAGIDYPRTFPEFEALFPTEAHCWDYVFQLRWPEGFVCPQCRVREDPWITARGYMHCKRCQGETSVTAQTLFERTRRPLRDWFLAIWFVTNQKQGSSALGLQEALGLGSYQTAWTWLHKLRRAMAPPGRQGLTEAVEVDLLHVGGAEAGPPHPENNRPANILAGAEIRGRGLGRIRLLPLADIESETLNAAVRKMVAAGSLIHTDKRSPIKDLQALGYRHKVVDIHPQGAPAPELMPRAARIALLLRRWLLGTHHGGVQKKHLDYYLDEFTFRFNRRASQSRGLLFYRLMQQAVILDPMPLKKIVGGKK